MLFYVARQADRFYDGDIFMDAGESDAVLGIENKGAHTHPLRTPDNIYEFKDTKPPKLIHDSASLRSPSSMGITQTTKAGSQSSLSAISLKESPVTPIPRDITDKSSKFSDRSISTNPRGRYEDGRNLLSNQNKSRETMTDDSPSEHKTSLTPIPTARKSIATSIKSSKTHLIEGIPQTEV